MCLDLEYLLFFLHEMVNQFELVLEVDFLFCSKFLDLDSNSDHKENDFSNYESEHQLELNPNPDLGDTRLDLEYLLVIVEEMVNQFGLVLEVGFLFCSKFLDLDLNWEHKHNDPSTHECEH
jgi:hypothetical protein